MTHQKHEATHQQSEGSHQAYTSHDGHRQQHDEPCKEEHRLISVANGDRSADNPAKCQGERKDTPRQCHEPSKAGVAFPAREEADGNKTEREIEDEKQRGKGHMVVDFLRPHLGLRRNGAASEPVLILP